MKTNNENDLVEIFAGSSMEAEIVRSLLKDAEIAAFLKNEIMGTLAPWHTSPSGVNPVKILVSSKDLDKALQFVKKYQENEKELK